uniref:Uncharacterized protein n=1 Tax=Caulobacter sp. (strain K31) TaxID=366602 RepID=B0SX04_CAUSK
MSTLVARITPALDTSWFGLVETSLRVLLVAAAPVCAVIFVVQSL